MTCSLQPPPGVGLSSNTVPQPVTTPLVVHTAEPPPALEVPNRLPAASMVRLFGVAASLPPAKLYRVVTRQWPGALTRAIEPEHRAVAGCATGFSDAVEGAVGPSHQMTRGRAAICAAAELVERFERCGVRAGSQNGRRG